MNIIIGCLFSGWIDRHTCSWVRREPRFKLLIDGQDYSSRAASQGIGAVSAIGQGGAVDSLNNYRIYGLVEDCLGPVVNAGQVDRVLDMKPLTSCQSLLRSQLQFNLWHAQSFVHVCHVVYMNTLVLQYVCNSNDSLHFWGFLYTVVMFSAN